MSVERAVVRVVNSAGPTSSPLNQFALYRARTHTEEHNDLVVLSSVAPETADLVGDPIFGGRLGIFSGDGSVVRLLQQVHRRIAHHRRAGVPVLIHLHHASSGALIQFQRRLLFRDVPILYTVHNTVHHYPLRNRTLARLNSVMATGVTFVSETSYHAFPKTWLPADKLRVVTNGVDLNRIDEAVASARSEDISGRKEFFELVTVGRLVTAKNQAFMVELVSHLPDDVRLTIVGDGVLATDLKDLAARLGVGERVRFTGLVPRDTVFRMMVAADLFVSCSGWEGLPVAVLEAMAVGLPVVLSDIGPHRELADRSSGVCIAPVSLTRWSEAVLDFIERSDELAALGAANREAVEMHFSLQRMQADYTQVYERLWPDRAAV